MSAPRVAIYARQSVDEEQGISQQLHDCHTEAARRGWHVVYEFPDNDTSATKARGRDTKWANMLAAFDNGDFDVLIATDVDRITRTLSDVLEITAPRRPMRVVTIRGGIDTDHDDFMIKQLVLLAEREIKLKTARARRYAIERRAAGHPQAGSTAYGYTWVAKRDRDALGTRWVVNEEEAPIVKAIFAEFTAGAPLGQIARDLNTAGLTARSGSKWIASTVRRILMNPVYGALLPPVQPSGKHALRNVKIEECTEGSWEPIIPRELVIGARTQLLGVQPLHQGTARKWLLSGLAICSVCRQPVRAARGKTHPTPRNDGSGVAPSTRYLTYRCVNGHLMRNGDIINDVVRETVIDRLSRPDALSLLSPATEEIDLAVLEARRIDLQSRRSDIVTLVGKGRFSISEAERELDRLDEEIAALDREFTKAVMRNPFADVAAADDVRSWWETATLARRRTVIDLLMKVVIHPVGMGRRIHTIKQAAETITVESQPDV